MNDKRWNISSEMLATLRLIRSNCRMCSNCEWCPFESPELMHPCMLQEYPANWNLDNLEAYDEEEN